jgi:hypothetical protein
MGVEIDLINRIIGVKMVTDSMTSEQIGHILRVHNKLLGTQN